MKKRNTPAKPRASCDATVTELAALKKRVAELEAQQIKDLFLRPVPGLPFPPAVPTVNPNPWAPALPYIPNVPVQPPWEFSGHGGNCACPRCCPPVWCETTANPTRFIEAAAVNWTPQQRAAFTACAPPPWAGQSLDVVTIGPNAFAGTIVHASPGSH